MPFLIGTMICIDLREFACYERHPGDARVKVGKTGSSRRRKTGANRGVSGRVGAHSRIGILGARALRAGPPFGRPELAYG